MVSTPQLHSSSGEQFSKLSQQGGLVGAHVSIDRHIPSWPAIHANGSTEPDTDSSTIGSNENSDHGFDHDIYDPMNDEHVSETEYNDSDNDRTMDDEGFSQSDIASVMSLDPTVENYFFWCGRQYPNQDTGYSYEPIDAIRTELWEEIYDARHWVSAGLQSVAISEDWQHSDLADNNPGIEVIGIGIVPIQPVCVPPNLEFEALTFEESSIDYIHARGLSGNVNRTILTRNAFKTLKPGGIIEFDEMAIDFGAREQDLQENPGLGDWKKFFVMAEEKLRTHFIFVNHEILPRELESAGFEDIQVRTNEIPLGTWARSTKVGELGQDFLETLTKDMVGSVLRIATEDLEWSEHRAQVFAATVRKYIILNCDRTRLGWPMKDGWAGSDVLLSDSSAYAASTYTLPWGAGTLALRQHGRYFRVPASTQPQKEENNNDDAGTAD
ncbi:Methyltransferase domain containing protein [Fusarium agapanthi]|uniref:Methyltransferase domain containing protein n=1 Tax=Fusarium agapanthi TaxID=1803897 RepID=A0A9P5BM19_9HYPO|nr:Methyltransferase domain containing protein [Fusarium agapanthi]